MNIRQTKYKANRLAGMNQVNAAIAAGYSDSYSRKQTKKLENVVKCSICDILEQAGLTDKYQANKIYELTLSKNEKVRLETLKHIADIKKHTDAKIRIENKITAINVNVKELDASSIRLKHRTA